MRKLLIYILILILFASELYSQHRLRDGIWRGELQVQDKQAPFLLKVSGANNIAGTKITLINGEEQTELNNISYINDTIFIPVTAYDAIIKATVGYDNIKGVFLKKYIEKDPGVPFLAKYNDIHRFKPVTNPSNIKIDGKWDVLFIEEKGDTARNVGIFKSEKNAIVTGSILTNSGDLRYLEGAYTSNGVQLSAFSGLSPYLFEFIFRDVNHFEGVFYTTRSKTRLLGTRNKNASLADPYSIANLKTGYKTLGFNLPNLEGKTISLKDTRYKGKVVIVSLLGSWCPNCLDETSYLAPWYEANKNRGIEVIGLAFERKDDPDYAKRTITQLKTKYKIGYEILFAGKAGSENISRVLPEIDGFGGYPTTLFIDKKGNVRKIHTGYNGPATGHFYEEFKKEFNGLVNQLVAE
jgi:peroxiredoxin